jgi:hypothetical protein
LVHSCRTLFAWIHSIYIKKVKPLKILFNFGTFCFFLAGLVWAEIEGKVDVALPKRPINKFKPVQQSRQPAWAGGLVTHGMFDARNCDAGILTFGILTHGDERRSDNMSNL